MQKERTESSPEETAVMSADTSGVALIELAANYAGREHTGQVRRGSDIPYIIHPTRVADRVRNKTDHEGRTNFHRYVAVAWLHDVVEDGASDQEVALRAVFPNEVADAVMAMTKSGGEDYGEYIQRVRENKIARLVKIEDILENISDTPTKRKLRVYARALITLV